MTSHSYFYVFVNQSVPNCTHGHANLPGIFVFREIQNLWNVESLQQCSMFKMRYSSSEDHRGY